MKISTGLSRTETNWQVKEFSWSEFVEKLRNPNRTRETFKEYVSLSKDKQDLIKDVGGFVGGSVSGGRRIKNSVAKRQLITLDADSAPKNFWTRFTEIFKCTAALYSTHSHSPEKPRFRLVIPLVREVSTEEYEAISRKIAGEIDIEFFDPTTFQVERLMYWPSCSVDGEYIFREQFENPLDPDKILGMYTDWKDVSTWPVSKKVAALNEKKMVPAEDPYLKKGTIGTFCRTYPIEIAIDTFLSDVYAPGSFGGRYTYILGSTANGVILYKDRWAYSHHATDPGGGRLLNAFDLIRLHKFGGLDMEILEGTPIVKYPSYIAMTEFIIRDEKVRRAIGEETIKNAYADFDGEDIDWMQNLKITRGGSYIDNAENAVMILLNDPRLRGCFTYNLFTERQCLVRNLPWRTIKTGIYWTDTDDSELRIYLERVYELENRLKIRDALNKVFMMQTFHPVRDYLFSLVWDGIPRIDKMLVDNLQASNSKYVRTISRKTMIAAVARIFEPGCKFDNVLMLVGPQGCGKSSFVKMLGGKWFSDSFGSIHNGKAVEQMQGVWVMEIGELAGLRKAEVEEIKQFLSKDDDTFRVPYDKFVVTRKRQTIFIATTNDYTPLQDQSGGRRFWPVEVSGFPRTWVNRDQFWAEAVVAYESYETWHLDSEMESLARQEQESFTEEYRHGSTIRKFLDQQLPGDWRTKEINERVAWLSEDESIRESGIEKRKKVCALEIWCEALRGSKKDFTQYAAREINQFLSRQKDLVKAKEPYRDTMYGVVRGFITVVTK